MPEGPREYASLERRTSGERRSAFRRAVDVLRPRDQLSALLGDLSALLAELDGEEAAEERQDVANAIGDVASAIETLINAYRPTSS